MNIKSVTLGENNRCTTTVYYDSDISERYWHREDGPAYVNLYPDGKVKCEVYWFNNRVHREDGPARTEYYSSGKVKAVNYIIHDKWITYEEWYSKYGWKVQLKGTPMGEVYGS